MIQGEFMKKKELSEIIMEKIKQLDESENMKDFILKVLEKERYNIEYPKQNYLKDFEELATHYSNREGN